MKWTELSIDTTNEAVEPISNILHEAGAGGVVIEDSQDRYKQNKSKFGEVYEWNEEDFPKDGVRLKAYLPVNSFLGETVSEIKQAINQLVTYDIDIGPNKITLNEVNEEDWSTAWKKYYKPVKISKRITVSPTWEDYKKESEDEIVIELDPGMAFGTGTHPTTVLSIQALERYVQENQVVIDVGCGSGVLSIASVYLGAKHVHAFDLDEVAVKSAKSNVKVNGLANQITVKQNNLLQNVTVQAEIIVANILAEIILLFEKDAFQLLKPNGIFITSGIIQTKKQEVKAALENVGFVIVEINEMEDWVSIIARKPQESR